MNKRYRLQIPCDLHNAMLAHAVAEFPRECCGILAGVVREEIVIVSRHFPLANCAADPRTEYLSEPRGMLAADKAMRALDLDLVAIYHSHPISQPIPSRKDVERNYSDDVMNLIISLQDGQPKMRAWWLINCAFVEGEWELFDSAGV